MMWSREQTEDVEGSEVMTRIPYVFEISDILKNKLSHVNYKSRELLDFDKVIIVNPEKCNPCRDELISRAIWTEYRVEEETAKDCTNCSKNDRSNYRKLW